MHEFKDLAKLIDNLLFLARSDYGQLSVTYELFSAREEIQNLFEFYQGLAEEKQIRLHCHGDIDLHVDRGLFKRMMINLLSNALRYTPQGGDIWIDLTSDAAQHIITVRDSGIGIPAQHIQNATLCLN